MQRSSPAYTTGTVTGTIGTSVIYGTGTNWVSSIAGSLTDAVAKDDELQIAGYRTILIASVDSASQITLAEPLPFGIPAGTPYRIIQHSISAAASVLAILQRLVGQGSDSTPDAYRTLDNGVSRLRIGFAAGGQIQLQVRPSSATDSSYATAILIDPATGNVTATGLTGGSGGAIANTVRATTGKPANGIGIPGDFAIDPLARMIYGPKAVGTWPAGISFAGKDADLTTLNLAVASAQGAASSAAAAVTTATAQATAASASAAQAQQVSDSFNLSGPDGLVERVLAGIAAQQQTNSLIFAGVF